MAKKIQTSKTDGKKEIVRATFRFHGPDLAQIRDVRDMSSLNSEVDAARYLMQRGLAVRAPDIGHHRSIADNQHSIARQSG